MFELLTRKWWSIVVRGLSALLFGLAAIAWPDRTLASLVVFYGIFTITDGVLALAALFDRAPTRRRWSLVVSGGLNLLVGVLALVRPGLIGLTWLSIIAVWAIATGGLTILAASELRKELRGEWLLGLSGGASLLFGAGLLLSPAVVALALGGVLAVYAITVGVLLIALGLRLRRVAQARRQPAVFRAA